MKDINDLSIFARVIRWASCWAIRLGRVMPIQPSLIAALPLLILRSMYSNRPKVACRKAINSRRDEWERYWALMTCAVIGEKAEASGGGC